jgi:hypothetical protein
MFTLFSNLKRCGRELERKQQQQGDSCTPYRPVVVD